MTLPVRDGALLSGPGQRGTMVVPERQSAVGVIILPRTGCGWRWILCERRYLEARSYIVSLHPQPYLMVCCVSEYTSHVTRGLLGRNARCCSTYGRYIPVVTFRGRRGCPGQVRFGLAGLSRPAMREPHRKRCCSSISWLHGSKQVAHPSGRSELDQRTADVNIKECG